MKKYGVFCKASFVELLVEFAFIAAVGDIGFEDVAVTGFELFQDAAFIDDTGAAVVGKAG